MASDSSLPRAKTSLAGVAIGLAIGLLIGYSAGRRLLPQPKPPETSKVASADLTRHPAQGGISFEVGEGKSQFSERLGFIGRFYNSDPVGSRPVSPSFSANAEYANYAYEIALYGDHITGYATAGGSGDIVGLALFDASDSVMDKQSDVKDLSLEDFRKKRRVVWSYDFPSNTVQSSTAKSSESYPGHGLVGTWPYIRIDELAVGQYVWGNLCRAKYDLAVFWSTSRMDVLEPHFEPYEIPEWP